MSLDHVSSSSWLASQDRALGHGARPVGPARASVGGASLPADIPDAAYGAIESVVTQVFGVTHADLSIRSRGKAHVALARQVAMYLTHVVCGLTLTEVGQLFGRDRTTVAHACAVVEDRRDDLVFDRALDLLEWALPSLLARARFLGEGMA